MAKRKDADSQRYRWYEDDRSGFQYGFQPITSKPNKYSRESGKPITDLGLKVSPLSYDTPPPSKKSLGGEGDVSGSPRDNSNPSPASDVYVIPPESTKVIVTVTSSNSIAWNTNPIVYLFTTTNLIMAVNPQFVSGKQGQLIAVQCVGSSITLKSGSGLTFDFTASQIRMDSGGIATLLYNATDSTWHITSFNPTGGF